MKYIALILSLFITSCQSYINEECITTTHQRFVQCPHKNHIGYWSFDSSELNSISFYCICK